MCITELANWELNLCLLIFLTTSQTEQFFMPTHADKAINAFTHEYAFLTPLLLPWVQQLCVSAATESLKELYNTPLPSQNKEGLVSKTDITFHKIRINYIPQIIAHIKKQQNPRKYVCIPLSSLSLRNSPFFVSFLSIRFFLFVRHVFVFFFFV